jgi:aspartyl-tRNA(Asn)/glutamyl-tRNA(Gln) amidotransferase subunit C
MAAPLTREDVLRVARLAQLELDEGEVELLTRELGQIVGYFDELSRVDTSGVEPTAHLAVEKLPLREDTLRPGTPPELALAEAPRTGDGGFAVPAFVSEG